MARILQDSDDELPDLADLLKRPQGVSWRKTSAATSGKAALGREETMSAKAKPDGKYGLTNAIERESITMEKKTEPVGRPKSRKRVLKQTSDNPLLLPIARTHTTAASSDLVSVPGGWKMKSRQKDEDRIAVEKTSPMPPPVKFGLAEEKPHGVEATKKMEGRKAVGKKPPKPERRDQSDEEDFYDESDDLSDFVVNDSSFLEEEDSVIENKSPPKSVRRLVKGRRQARDRSPAEDDLDIRMGQLTVKDGVPTDIRYEPRVNQNDRRSRGSHSPKTSWDKQSKTFKSKEVVSESDQKAAEPSSDIEDPFTLRFSPSENKPRKVSKELRFATPPGSPEIKPRGLISPKKLPRIPLTPHRPSMESFWQQNVINDWNDEFSPRKTPKTLPKLQLDGDEYTPDAAMLFSPTKKSPAKHDRAAREAKKAFSQRKHELAESFLGELDNKITHGQISELAKSTGGVKINWSKKLNTTAGRANWKRETIRPSRGLDGRPGPTTYRHHAAIELAEKVIDDEDRLLNVIAHEFCHLANFMVSNIKTNPHGKEFKAWAAKCSHHFAGRGIQVTTKHSYTIDYKYIWECSNCGLEFQRHSKSIDPSRHQCGTCKSKLVQTKPAPRNTGPVKMGEYQVFVKENMKRVREENPGSPQKEIMGLVGKKYQEYKASKFRDDKSLESVSVEEFVGSKRSSPEEEEVASVARKLDFLDLTSP